MRRLQVTLPDALVHALMAQSEAQDVPLTTLIVQAVEAYLAMAIAPQSGESNETKAVR
jgi:hypothetical protein